MRIARILNNRLLKVVEREGVAETGEIQNVWYDGICNERREECGECCRRICWQCCESLGKVARRWADEAGHASSKKVAVPHACMLVPGWSSDKAIRAPNLFALEARP